MDEQLKNRLRSLIEWRKRKIESDESLIEFLSSGVKDASERERKVIGKWLDTYEQEKAEQERLIEEIRTDLAKAGFPD